MASPRVPSALPGDLAGSSIGRYEIVSRIGAGGMGEVYVAKDAALQRLVALKRVHPRHGLDRSHVQRLLREAQRISALNHPAIAQIYDVVQDCGAAVLVMEYVEGSTLRAFMKEPADPYQLINIAIRCCEALAAAHNKRIVHGDVKPENIMLTRQGEIKLLDFGMARKQTAGRDGADALASTTLLDSNVGGTPSYMAPEVLLGQEPDARSDLFSLGMVLYEALSGQHPFPAETLMQRTERIVHRSPLPLSNFGRALPSGLDSIVSKLLEKEAPQRYESADEVLRDLKSVQTGSGKITALRYGVRRVLRRRSSASLILLLIFAAITSVVLRGPRSPDAPPPQLPDHKFVAVLPFRVIEGTPQDQALVDGLCVTINAWLTKFSTDHNLQVISAEELHRNGIKDTEAARKTFGVNLVVQGTVYRSGEGIRVNIAIVDTRSKSNIRADTLTASIADPFDFQDRTAAAVASLLALDIQPESQASIRKPAAQELYLRGKGYLHREDPASIESAILSFTEALAADPQHVDARAGLGESYRLRYLLQRKGDDLVAAENNCRRALAQAPKHVPALLCWGSTREIRGQHTEAVKVYEQALAREPTNDEAYRLLGVSYQAHGNFADAERNYKRAIEIRPEYWKGYSWLGSLYINRAMPLPAIKQFKKAIEVAPDGSMSYAFLAAAYGLAGDFEKAAASAKQSIAIEPSAGAYSNLGLALLYNGRPHEAVHALEQARALSDAGHYVSGNLARAYYWAGDAGKAREMFRDAVRKAEATLRINPTNTDVQIALANYFAMLGDKKGSFRYLNRALSSRPENSEYHFYAAMVQMQFKQRAAALSSLKKAVNLGYSRHEIAASPEFKTLRSDPRFQALLGPLKAEASP